MNPEICFSIEIGNGYPILIIRSGSLKQVIQQVPLTSSKCIDHLCDLLYTAKQSMEDMKNE